ncbi:MAG: molybdopterin molybdenumtransferase MoeA, partial [Arenimonas sp.]|nr:molybdopterin molybdenumtransferase MoeA [Arenimonas sp.]
MTPDVPTRISYAQALAIIASVGALARLPTEQAPLSRARGAVLAADVVAAMPLPGFDNSAMDGFALRADDANASGQGGLLLAGEQFAGPSRALALGEGECSRITTGAPLPSGADTVVMKEDAQVRDDRVHFAAPVRQGAHVRWTGEDVAIGDTVLRAGQPLTPARL